MIHSESVTAQEFLGRSDAYVSAYRVPVSTADAYSNGQRARIAVVTWLFSDIHDCEFSLGPVEVVPDK